MKWAHRGGVCTFETLIVEFGLSGDAALMRPARIVYDALYAWCRREVRTGVM